MLLKNDSILIREFSVLDIENKVRWINNSENNMYLHYDIPLEYEKTLAWFYSKNNSNRLDCVIEYDEIPVGLIGLLNIDRVNNKCEFYISVGEISYKRKGIGLISTNMIIDYAFNELGMSKVYLNVDVDNTAACRMYEKIGFKCEGVFIDDMIRKNKYIDRKRYAILKKDRNI